MDNQLIGSDSPFTDIERKVIAAICDGNIAAADGMPAASDPQVFSTVLDKAAHFADRLKSNIKILCDERDPLALDPVELVDQLDRDPRYRSFSRILTIVTMQAYYQDPRVLAAAGLPARPPFPEGHEMEPDDWSLLDPVKQRGTLYRPA